MFGFDFSGRAMMAVVIGAASLSACASQKTIETPPTPSAAPVVPAPVPIPAPGSDRDAHGCIPSAGYSWCAKENSCVRPWELAAKKSFKNTQEAYEAYCSGKSK